MPREDAMAYDEKLAERIRDVLADEPDMTERKMFGGIAFMVRDHMCCGILGQDLMLRLGEDGADKALTRPHVREMDFGPRPSSTMVFVAPAGLKGQALGRWVGLARDFVATLPPKKPKTPKAPRASRQPRR